jgi:hypothetical protein
MKEFELMYQGAKAKIVINDKPTARQILKIIEPPIVVQKGLGGAPEVNLKEYFVYLGTNMIMQAPWRLQNVDALLDLDGQTFTQLCKILGDEFPFMDFLSPALKLLYGKNLELPSPSQTESTLKPSSAESRSG